MTTKFNIFPFPNLGSGILLNLPIRSFNKFKKVLRDYSLNIYAISISIKDAEYLGTTSSHILVIKPVKGGLSNPMLTGRDSLFLEDIITLSDEERELLACELFIRSMA